MLGTRLRLLTSIQAFLFLTVPPMWLQDHIVVRSPPFRIQVMMGLLRLILLSARQLNHILQVLISLQNCRLRRNWAARCASSLLGKLVRNMLFSEEYPQLFQQLVFYHKWKPTTHTMFKWIEANSIYLSLEGSTALRVCSSILLRIGNLSGLEERNPIWLHLFWCFQHLFF